MQIALFGGTFDPPHRAHFQIAQALIAQKIADQVWFVPVKQHPFGKGMSGDEHRVKMLEAMLQGAGGEQDLFRIESFELEHEGPSYSYLTLQSLSQQYPEHQFSWVIGSDNLASFHKWGYFQELLAGYKVYVYPRQGFPFEPLLAGMVPLSELPEINVTSTDVRQRVEQGQSISALVHPGVERYIHDHHLYVK